MLEIATFGGLSIRRDGEPAVELATREMEVLLVYLACTKRPYPHDVLGALLWDEQPRELAASDLRKALSDLGKHLGAYVTITADTAGLDPDADVWLDVEQLEAKLGAGQFEAAVEIYKGPFLEGFDVRGAAAFDRWMTQERQRLHQTVVDALQTLVAHAFARGDLRAAITYAARLLKLDPSPERVPWRDKLRTALRREQADPGDEGAVPTDAKSWRAAREQAALLRLSADLGATLDEAEICRRVVRGLHDTLGYDFLALMLVDETTGDRVVTASVGFEEPRTPVPPGQGLSERPLLDGQLHYTPDVTQDPRYFYGMAGSEVDVPVRIEGELLGVLVAESRQPYAFHRDDFEVLTAVAQQAGLAIGKARLLAAERKRVDELEALRTTMADITAELELPALLQAIVERAAGLLGATGGELGLYDEDNQEIRVVVSHNLGEHYVGTCHALGEGAMGRAAQAREPLIIRDYQTWEGRLTQYPQVHAVLVAPLEVGGRLVGVFTTVASDPAREFTSADLHLLNLFAQQAAIAINNARLYDQAQREIAERARAEEELRGYQGQLEELVEARAVELRESEQRYRTLFDGVPVGLYRTTPEGQIVDANLAQVHMLGYPDRERLLAINPANLYEDPKDRRGWQALMEREGVVRDFEIRFRRYDGTVIWVNDTARAVKDDRGRVLYYEGSLEDITERKRAEQELRKHQEHLEELVAERTAELRASEERYRTLFDGVPVGLYRSTPAGKAMDVNLAMAQMLGYAERADALLAINTLELYVNHQDRERWKELMKREGIVRDFEAQLYKRDGTIIWVNDTARAVKDAQGQVLYYEGSLEEITARKTFEEEIRRQKEYYEALFVNNPVAVVTADLNGDIVSWNPMAEKLFGYAQDEVIGVSLDDVVANDLLRTEALGYTKQVINVGRVQVTTRRTRKDGSLVDVELLALPVVVAGEKVGFIAIYHDITERKAIESELRRQKEYYEALFVNNPGAVVTVDLYGSVVSWNPAAEKLFGYKQEEVMGKNLDALVAADPRIQEEAIRYTHQVTTIGRVQATTRRVRQDGSLVDVEVLALPVIVGEEKVGYIGIYIDITDLQEARRQAEAANQAKSAFLANMSHELRTPLNAILGFTQLMDRDPNVTVDQLEYLGIINRSGEHLLTLINDVLEMSKIEAGKATLQAKAFDLYKQLDGLEEIFNLRAREQGLKLTFTRDENVPRYIVADEGKLGQVLGNLLGNAVKFTTEGGVTVRVTASPTAHTTEAGRRTLHFEVQDTGPGIVPEELPVIFDAFMQSEAGRNAREGTGLGLTISRQFVHLMGGDLTVTSELGQGTCFRFDVQVRLAPPEVAEMRLPRPRRRVVGIEPTQPSYRLLVAEDRETSRELLVRLLTLVGFQVREARNGQEAIEVWEHWEPHLIWMDMRMPVVDGYEATRRIKTTPGGQATVIIALTASAFEEDREQILSAGCNDFVRKPFREDEMFDMLTKHLGVRFVYEDVEPTVTPEAVGHLARQEVDAELARRLAALPSAWLANLEQAAILGELRLLLDLIDRIAELDTDLATALAGLAHEFEHERILMLVRAAGAER
jgi:PAS domain S-box-containing protein